MTCPPPADDRRDSRPQRWVVGCARSGELSMSETQKSDSRSNVSNELTNAQSVQRRAIARQSPDSDATAAIPDPRSADGDVKSLFDDDGSLIPAENADEATSETVDVEEDAEAFLKAVAPERLAEIDEKAGDLPMARGELVEFHARKAIKQAEERGEELHVESGVSFTLHQQPGEDKWASVDNDAESAGRTLDECPKCGKTDVSASTVESQTKAADESGTRMTKTSCGCTIRNSD